MNERLLLALPHRQFVFTFPDCRRYLIFFSDKGGWAMYGRRLPEPDQRTRAYASKASTGKPECFQLIRLVARCALIFEESSRFGYRRGGYGQT
jgi:hypothetical protein